ncbi:hypothetical protein NM208_g6858 [Fusarium decemcellulare]|uniref:Uncharacterized protein n=2 Tax=Fusarium decemcellulare TaxID=57161 RepID=A0ACC1SBI9_9HYPO|nr:hypothetical protein NM208_g11803 [Fusarium decemcellulare]KAJ3536117.1 hypothetical protein NM208_g6858 [Fusarium decemcellulare]
MMRQFAANLSGRSFMGGLPRSHWASHSIAYKRFFHKSLVYNALKPYLLADIGEGITECQIIKWFVKPGDKVQEFDGICEVQSDKASVEITSRYNGIIRSINYEVDDMAVVGSSLMDIEVDDQDIASADHTTPGPPTEEAKGTVSIQPVEQIDIVADHQDDTELRETAIEGRGQIASAPSTHKHPAIMLPAVRHLLKQHNIDLSDVTATGKGGRVLKEDVQRYLATKAATQDSEQIQPTSGISKSQENTTLPLTPIQDQMFHSMTRSLSIPHFLYTQAVDLTDITSLRKQWISNPKAPPRPTVDGSQVKLSSLPFILKALSHAASKYPILNSFVAHEAGTKPQLTLMASHNIGMAVDTPKGLIVPVIRNVQRHSIVSLASETERLSRLARDGKLSPDELKGATMLVSNIGSIGGQVVAPIIMPPMVMTIAVGQSQHVPVFREEGGTEKVAKREQVILSWSADHRVLDGATIARCAGEMAFWLENINMLSLTLA